MNPEVLAAATAEIKQVINFKKQTELRSELASLMGIADKGHSYHKGNFNSAQTIKAIMDNLYEPFRKMPRGENAARQQAINACLDRYKYNPEEGVCQV